jgi:hypothetical protein
MSKLYCEITESARRTIPTARAHTAGTVSIKNWSFAVETRMIDHGGGDNDTVEIKLIPLNSSVRPIVLFEGTIREMVDRFAPDHAPSY